MSEQASLTPARMPQRSLRSVLRNTLELTPGDSLHRFAQLARFEPMGLLPVTSGGRLLGTLSQSDIVRVLTADGQERLEREMERPVSDFMRPPVAALRSQMSMPEVARVFAESGQGALPVLDDQHYYLGMVSANDLLAGEPAAPRPARIGGMATPFGVYLTDGIAQAGVGNLALVASGFTMTALLMLAYRILDFAFLGLQHLTRRPLPLLLALGDDIPIRNPWLGLASVGESLLLFLVFMCLMRLTRLAGYHAAEHQTVHAIERFEPLSPNVVRRMPRAHPRCGTNIMAAVLVFMTVRQALGYIASLAGMVEIMAAVATLFAWRPVGTFLQERFTTKPAGDREIQSGIAAGEELLERYLDMAPVRPTLLRRIWCSGMVQILIGSTPMWLLALPLPFLEPIRLLLTGH